MSEGTDPLVGDPVAAWAASGAMALTGHAGGAPLSPAAAVLPALAALRDAAGLRGVVDLGQLLSGRAAALGLSRRGRVSANGSCRLLPTADGWIAVNLARPSDIESVAALVERTVDDDPWLTLTRAAAHIPTADLIARATLLALPAAPLPPPRPPSPATPRTPHPALVRPPNANTPAPQPSLPDSAGPAAASPSAGLPGPSSSRAQNKSPAAADPSAAMYAGVRGAEGLASPSGDPAPAPGPEAGRAGVGALVTAPLAPAAFRLRSPGPPREAPLDLRSTGEETSAPGAGLHGERRRREPREMKVGGQGMVVDLSGMWAGPVCARVLGLVGMRVVKVESTGRPDGARAGNVRFFDWLHGGHESVALDLASASGRAALARLVAAADVVIESSRPRALVQLGIDAEAVVAARPGVTWVSITGYGRDGEAGQRVAFGDDAAVAAGLVAYDDEGLPVFCGDAIADPITGLSAAAGALASIAAGGGHLVEVPMVGAVAAACAIPASPARATADAGWTITTPSGTHPVAPPHPLSAKPVTAAALGAHTAAVLAEIGITC
jgi:crotonobetainyl-CoA:carnitine CoA-transferase CaiB-like acyl-CoA transferase